MNRLRTDTAHRIARGLATTGVMLVAAAGVAGASTSATPQGTEPAFGLPLSARMATLFRDITLGSWTLGERLFFPESAYVAMKTGRIADPASDYVDRLVAFYRLDLTTYHDYLLARGPVAFVGVNANPREAVWIRPGWCENSIGYWHVPGVRLVYRQRGVVRSVGVASLISWHGVWYVVHLGPNPRAHNVGTVDAPAAGRGIAGPAGGC